MELGWPLQEVEKDICNWKGIWLNTKKNKQYNTLNLTIKTNNKVLVEYSPSKRQFQILDQEYITKRDIIQFVHACTTQDFITEKKLTLRMDLLLSSFNKRDLCLLLKFDTSQFCVKCLIRYREVLDNMGVTFPVEKGKWRVDQQRQQLYIWFETWRKSKARKYNIQQLE